MINLNVMSYGAYLHVKDNMFEILVREKGQADKKVLHPASKIKTITLGRGTSLSAEAIRLALEHHVHLVIVASDGQPIGRFWHSKLGSTTLIRKKQLEASLNAVGLLWTKEWVGEKMSRQADFVDSLRKHRPNQDEFLLQKANNIRNLKDSVSILEGENTASVADSLRGLEGTAGRIYFETLSKIIPEPYTFEGRSMRPALDAFNAFLNYAYGMLYSRIESALIIAGIDPYLGFLHRDGYNHLSMVFDFIEPYRVPIDVMVFKLFTGKKVNKSHFEEMVKGITLTKEGKSFLADAFLEVWEIDRLRYKNKNRTREQILQFEAHNFANRLIQKEVEEYDSLDIV